MAVVYINDLHSNEKIDRNYHNHGLAVITLILLRFMSRVRAMALCSIRLECGAYSYIAVIQVG